MIRIAIPYIYNLHEALIALEGIQQGDNHGKHLFAIINANNLLDQFLNKSLWATALRVCRKPGNDLLVQLQTIFGGDDNFNSESELEYWRIVNLQQQLARFKAVLEAEFMTTAAYLVTPKRGYDIPTLIDEAENIFPEQLMLKVPDVQFDLREAGKSIAFNLGTAAGFHLLRALETVIRSYWNATMQGAPLPQNRNLGAYIKDMEGHADAKVLAALKQIKDHHRNELMHPEETLDLDQAIALLGITQSAIVAMLKDIPEAALISQPAQLENQA